MHETAINAAAANSPLNASVMPKDEDLDLKEIVRMRYRTTQKDDQMHALTAMHSRKNSDEDLNIYKTEDTRQSMY